MLEQINTLRKPDGTYPLYRWMNEEERKWIIAHNFRHWMENDIPLKLKEQK